MPPQLCRSSILAMAVDYDADGSLLLQDYSLHLPEVETVPAEEIRCVFDDNSKIIFVKSSYKPMLWGCSLESPHEAILMSTYNISFYEEISKIISYHQICTLFLLLQSS